MTTDGARLSTGSVLACSLFVGFVVCGPPPRRRGPLSLRDRQLQVFQPVFVRTRIDKDETACTIDQLKGTNRVLVGHD